MNAKKYLKESSRTASSDYPAITDRMAPAVKSNKSGQIVNQREKIVDLQHAMIGMVTESAEFADMIKKHLYYGKALDEVNLAEEVGDLLWYCAMALRALGTDFETVMETNIEKLKARYPDKFSAEKAENRDLEKEREVLEGMSGEPEHIETIVSRANLVDLGLSIEQFLSSRFPDYTPVYMTETSSRLSYEVMLRKGKVK